MTVEMRRSLTYTSDSLDGDRLSEPELQMLWPGFAVQRREPVPRVDLPAESHDIYN